MIAKQRRPNLTEAEKAWAAQQRERGWSHERIAKELKCSPGAVAWHCLAAGADPPNAKPIDTTIRGPLTYQRNGKPVRRFTPEDDKKLIELSLLGKTDTEMARALGRRPNSVRGRLMTLARHDARNEQRNEKAA